MGETSKSESSLTKTIHSLSINNMKIDVPKFDGKINFGLWRCQVMDALDAQNLEETLELQERPADMEAKVWKKMNSRACGVIRSCLTPDLIYDVMNETTAKKMWETLNEKYLTKSIENRLHLKKRFYQFKMKRGVSIREHVNNFTKLLSDMVNVDIMVEDEDKAMLLLCSLPEDDFGTFVLTMINGRTTVSYKEVTSALVNYELRKSVDESSEKASGDALVVQGRDSNRSRRSQSRGAHRGIRRNQCAFCKEDGHWKAECPKRDRAGKNKGKAAEASEVNVVKSSGNNSDSDSSGYSLSALPSACVANSTEWVLDSGASYHICPRRDWFSSFQKLEREDVVLMGNGHACSIGGIGTVRIRMSDGMIREVDDVRFVPQLKMNIISLGALEAAGYRVTLVDARLKVTLGSMIVMKGVRRSNLYYLLGSTAIDREMTTSSDSARLWRCLMLGYLIGSAVHDLVRSALTCRLKSCDHIGMSEKTEMELGTSIHHSRGLLRGVHSGIWGPSKGASLGGNRYVVSAVGDCSRHWWVATKSRWCEVLEARNRWRKCVGRKVTRRSDYGRGSFLRLCRAHGNRRHFISAETLRRRGEMADLGSCSLLEEDRRLMSSIGIGVQATTCLGHLMHRLPTAACRDFGSGGAASDFGLRRMFGYPALGHIVDVRLDPTAHLGFRGVFDYQVLASDSVLSRYVTFDSRQVESGDQIIGTSQRVESDATPRLVKTPDHTASFGIPADVTQIGNRVGLDADDSLIDASAADRCSPDMAIGSSQVEMFGLSQFGAFGAIGGAISRRLDRDVGEGLRTLLVD